MVSENEIQARLTHIRERIGVACTKVGRTPDEVRIIAVTKNFPEELVRKACALGFQDIGENRVQESLDKYKDDWFRQEYPDRNLHLIGHLQSNKVRKATGLFDSIDSVDSLDLAQKIDRVAGELDRHHRVLLEVNTSGETQKSGLDPEETTDTALEVAKLLNLSLAGLMTVGPLTDNPEEIRTSFRMLNQLFHEIAQRLKSPDWQVLSMGMSNDYEIAIEAGATEIRLGTALFGPRS